MGALWSFAYRLALWLVRLKVLPTYGGATFLKEAYGLDIATASYTTSMIFMGMCVGAPLLPAVADKIRQHLGVVIVAGVVMALAFVGLLLVAIEVKNLCISFFVIGICCAYQIVAIYKASTYVPEHMVGLTTAVANMIIMSFGYAFHALIGYVIYAYGSSQSVHALFYGVSVIPIALTVGILGFSSLILQRNH